LVTSYPKNIMSATPALTPAERKQRLEEARVERRRREEEARLKEEEELAAIAEAEEEERKKAEEEEERKRAEEARKVEEERVAEERRRAAEAEEERRVAEERRKAAEAEEERRVAAEEQQVAGDVAPEEDESGKWDNGEWERKLAAEAAKSMHEHQAAASGSGEREDLVMGEAGACWNCRSRGLECVRNE
jgi:hypothetical protein